MAQAACWSLAVRHWQRATLYCNKQFNAISAKNDHRQCNVVRMFPCKWPQPCRWRLLPLCTVLWVRAVVSLCEGLKVDTLECLSAVKHARCSWRTISRPPCLQKPLPKVQCGVCGIRSFIGLIDHACRWTRFHFFFFFFTTYTRIVKEGEKFAIHLDRSNASGDIEVRKLVKKRSHSPRSLCYTNFGIIFLSRSVLWNVIKQDTDWCCGLETGSPVASL